MTSSGAVGLTLTGDAELDGRLARLESGASRIAERAALAGAKPIEIAIRALAPRGETGRLQRSVGRRRLNKTREGQRGAKVGLNVNRRSARNRAPHAHLLTLGTANRWTGSTTRAPRRRSRYGLTQGVQTGHKRAFRGRVTPRDFVSRAVTTAMPYAEAEMQRTVFDELEKVAGS